MWTCHTKPVGNERERSNADDSLSIVESTKVLYVGLYDEEELAFSHHYISFLLSFSTSACDKKAHVHLYGLFLLRAFISE